MTVIRKIKSNKIMFSTRLLECFNLWHISFGHVNLNTIRRLVNLNLRHISAKFALRQKWSKHYLIQ